MRKIIIFVVLYTTVWGDLMNQWFVAFKKNDGVHPYELLHDYTPMFPPNGKFYADPMLFKYNGINYIFFEEYDYNKGVISFITVDEDLNISTPIRVLELDTHLSFPFLFQEEGHIYMLPESCSSQEVALYEADNFPYNWVNK